MIKSVDPSYAKRLTLLAELILEHPNSKLRKLQKTALREYPTENRVLYRHCMSTTFATTAEHLANRMRSK